MLISVLGQFGITARDILLHKFEALSPDSFIWLISVDGKRYCLYAEDFVPSLKHVENAINSNLLKWEPHDQFELAKVSEVTEWQNASPVISANTYKQPKNPDELMKYAATSGTDFVFLGQSIHN